MFETTLGQTRYIVNTPKKFVETLSDKTPNEVLN